MLLIKLLVFYCLISCSFKTLQIFRLAPGPPLATPEVDTVCDIYNEMSSQGPIITYMMYVYWKSLKFDLSPRYNSVIHRHQNLYSLSTQCKIYPNLNRFFLPIWAKLRISGLAIISLRFLVSCFLSPTARYSRKIC